jgi:hypothetical protein
MNYNKKEITETKLLELLETIDSLKKGLEQEILTRRE